jgi:hypothetical protein
MTMRAQTLTGTLGTIQDATLSCLACGHNYTYHGSIEVFERGEDEQTGLHVTVANKKAKIDTDLTGNPSLRRYGLTIEVHCESCEAVSTLSIVQHKGETFIEYTLKENGS